MIRLGAEKFIVFGEVDTGAAPTRLGVEGSESGVRARIAGGAARSLAELAQALPVQIIDPEVHKLIEEGPSRRRRYLDWGVFHVERPFIETWQRYQLVLRQRNAALKARQPKIIVGAWDRDLTRCAEEISGARKRYVERLTGPAAALGQKLLGAEISLHYRSGWNKDQPFAAALENSWPNDVERGSTQVGPHRADLVVHLDGRTAKDHVSRGQQKLLAAALLMAQIELFPADAVVRPTLLLDDPAAELDSQHLASLIAEVSGKGTQLIVTTLQPEFPALGVPGHRYALREGRLTAL